MLALSGALYRGAVLEVLASERKDEHDDKGLIREQVACLVESAQVGSTQARVM